MSIIIAILVVVFFIPIVSFLFSGIVLLLGGSFYLIEKNWYLLMSLFLFVVGITSYVLAKRLLTRSQIKSRRRKAANIKGPISNNAVGIGELMSDLQYKKIRSCISHRTSKEVNAFKITFELDTQNLDSLLAKRRKTTSEILGNWSPYLQSMTYEISHSTTTINNRVRDIVFNFTIADNSKLLSLVQPYLPKDAVKYKEVHKKGRRYYIYKSDLINKTYTNDLTDDDSEHLIGEKISGAVIVELSDSSHYSNDYRVNLYSF